MKLNLHNAKFADWEYITDEKRNIWQKIASRSYGTLTPANVASLAGAVLAVYGLFIISRGQIVSGIIFLSIGRVADLLDGAIAEYTRTKSPLGESIDAVADKIAVAVAVVIFAYGQLVPLAIILIIGLQNGINGVASVAARFRKTKLHPSKFGKYSTALAWLTLIFFPLGTWVKQNESQITGSILIFIALFSFVFYVFIGYIASYKYVRSALAKT